MNFIISRSASNERGAVMVKSLFVLGFILALGLAFLLYTFGQVVSPGFVGVRQIAFGPYRGFSEKGLKPGYHWVIPFYSRIYLVPQTITLLDFHRDGKPGEDSTQPLEVPTADRATVNVDLSVLTRFYPEPGSDEGVIHGGPANLLTLGIEPDSWERSIKRSAENALRRSLSELSTSEFYDPELREAKLLAASHVMNENLMPLGIKVEALLLRRYTYEAGIEDSIFKKNLEELKRELGEKEANYAKAEGEVENVKSEFIGNIAAIKEDGERKAAVLRSEGDLYEAEKKAQGDLLVAKARAEVDRLRAGILAKSVGADIYVARELAPLLASLKGGVVTDLDPYDLDAWMRRFGIKEVK